MKNPPRSANAPVAASNRDVSRGTNGVVLCVLAIALAGCAAEEPFVRTKLDREPRVKTQESAEFNADPSDMQKQKTTAFYQTPKPPTAMRGAAGSPPPAPLAKGSGETVASINLESMPLPQFVTAVFNGILKLNVSMDPQVAQRTDMVSLRTGKPQTDEQIFHAAQMVLRSYGVAVREFNGLVRATPENSTQSGTLPEIRRGRAQPDVPEGLRPIFYLAELENTNVGQAVNWIRTLFPGRITATEDAQRNSIMLSGQSDAVKAALEALQLLDQPLMRGRLSARIVPVFWSSEEMAKRLVEMLNAEGYAASQSAMAPSPVLVLPIAPVNSVIVFASSQNVLNHVLRWAQELDQAPPGRGGGYITYHVRNTDATDLAAVLKDVMGETTGMAAGVTTPSAAGATGTASSMPAAIPAARSSGSRVVVNKQGNSLIIKTTPAEYQQWYGLLQELDRPSRTALIMATVAEVYLEEKEEFGFTWMLNQFKINGHLINTGTSASPGTTSSVANETFRIAVANSSGDPRALLTAMANDNRTKLLANPSIMTRNGETATIQVGQEVPITTSTISTAATSNAGTTTQNNVQYRSTGVILKVKPIIHSGGRIEIDVSQEVSSAAKNETSGISSPIISTRKIDTKLSVSEGNTILLGGLMRSDTSKNIGGIPYLKDIPYVGALFRTSYSTSENRTELIVMLTPYIVEDDFDARSVTEAFRNQFSWAKEAAPLKAREDKKVSGDSEVNEKETSAATLPPAAAIQTEVDVPSGSASASAVADKKAPEKAATTNGAVRDRQKAGSSETSEFRSQPYLLPDKDSVAPVVVPNAPVTASSVVPVQQNFTPPPAATVPSDAKAKAGMIDSPPVQDLPKKADEARPVTDEALKRELLEAIGGASSGGRK